MVNQVIDFAIKEFARYKKFIYQTALVFLSQIFVLLVGIVSKTFQTRGLGPEGFGLYAFFGMVTGFTIVFFRFGFYSSLQVLLAKNTDVQTERELVGAGIVITFFLGIVYALFIFLGSFFIDYLFDLEFGRQLRIVSPLCLVLPFRSNIDTFSVGTNKVENDAIFRVLNKSIFLALLACLFFFRLLGVLVLVTTEFAVTAVVVVVILRRYKPVLKNLKLHFIDIWRGIKEFGFHKFFGGAIAQTTYKLDGMMIAYFRNTTSLGFYSLGNIMCSPIVQMSRFLSNSIYKKLAFKEKVPSKVFLYNGIWLFISFILLLSLGPWVVVTLFGSKFSAVSAFLLPLGLASLANGLYYPANTFLGLKKMGKWMMKNSIIGTVVNIAGNLILIPIYGALGAAWASFISLSVFATACYYHYFKLVGLIKAGKIPV